MIDLSKTCIRPYTIPLDSRRSTPSPLPNPEEVVIASEEMALPAMHSLHEVLARYDYKTQVIPVVNLLHPVLADIVDMTHIGKLDSDIGTILELSLPLVSYLRSKAIAQLSFLLQRPKLMHGDLDSLVESHFSVLDLKVLHIMWDDPSQVRCARIVGRGQPWVSVKFKELIYTLQTLVDTGHPEVLPILVHLRTIRDQKLYDIMSYHEGHPSKGKKKPSRVNIDNPSVQPP